MKTINKIKKRIREEMAEFQLSKYTKLSSNGIDRYWTSGLEILEKILDEELK
jgi:hypothetical protein